MRTCTICSTPDRDGIDRAIIGGGTLRDIAGQFGVSKSAVARHKPHIAAMVKAHDADVADSLQTNLTRAQGRVESLYEVAEGILRAAVESGNAAAALKAVKTACGVLSEARALHELRSAEEIAKPDTRDIDAQIGAALRKRDERIRAAVIAELSGAPAVDTSSMRAYELLHAYDGLKQ
jgi:hypothetical protein